jgi:ethanolamine-phosphate cytidylyltransferase
MMLCLCGLCECLESLPSGYSHPPTSHPFYYRQFRRQFFNGPGPWLLPSPCQASSPKPRRSFHWFFYLDFPFVFISTSTCYLYQVRYIKYRFVFFAFKSRQVSKNNELRDAVKKQKILYIGHYLFSVVFRGMDIVVHQNDKVIDLVETEILKQTSDVGNPNERQRIRNAVVDYYINSIRRLSVSTPINKTWESYKRTFTKAGEPVRIYVDGCFDLLHAGHFNVLRQAKNAFDREQGENGCVLVAGVHSAKVIAEQKGPTIMTDEERLAVVQGCKYVDEVAFDTPYSPSVQVLNQLRCDFCVHGDDLPLDAKTGKHAYSEVQDAGRLRIVKRTECVSTTEIIGRLLSMSKEHKRTRLTSLKVEKRSFLATSCRVAQFGNGTTPLANDTVVYIQGSFDIFNADHVKMLAKAKEFGTFLLVGVLGDEAVSAVTNEANFPIMPLNERALAVLSSQYTDDCILGCPTKVTDEMITAFNIKTIVQFKSESSNINQCQYLGTREDVKVIELKSFECISPEVILERLMSNRQKFVDRNKKRVQMEENYVAGKSFIAGN